MYDSPIKTAPRTTGSVSDISQREDYLVTTAEEAAEAAEIESRKASRIVSERVGRFHAAAAAREEEESKIAAVAAIRATTDEEVRIRLETQARLQAEAAAAAAAREVELRAEAEVAAQAAAEVAALKKAAELTDAGPPLSEILGRVTARVVKKIYKRQAGSKRPKGTIRKVWYYTFEGERLGPVAFKELRLMAADYTLHPRLDLVWRQGMETWKPAGEVDGLFERRIVPVASPPAVVAPVVFRQSPSPRSLLSTQASWPGVRRPIFLLGSLLFPFGWHYFVTLAEPHLSRELGHTMMAVLMPFSPLVSVVLVTHLLLQRLSNVGMDRRWILGCFMPIVNFWVGYRCLVCPAGYAYHKKLDGAGIGLAIVYGSVLMLAGLAVMGGIALLFDPAHCPPQWLPLREVVRSVVQFFQ